MTPQQLEQAINDSGFPLQLGLRALAQESTWPVCLTEHAWRDPLGESEKFIDLVLKGRGSNDPQRLVIECKRAKDTEWIFLRTDAGDGHRSYLRARMAAAYVGAVSPVDDWVNVQFAPSSPEASFCVVRKGGQRSQELLEKTAAELTRATDALARQELLIHSSRPRGLAGVSGGLARLYVPVIVTTAKMYVCDADYRNVDLETGEVSAAETAPVPVVRFRKSLGVDRGTAPAVTSVEDLAEQAERSVLVVQAGAFLEFLEKANIMKRTDRELLEALFANGG
jgi:hypothetical protein